ncbi:hypothetical protein ACJX0J_031663, partial [Zea mays]
IDGSENTSDQAMACTNKYKSSMQFSCHQQTIDSIAKETCEYMAILLVSLMVYNIKSSTKGVTQQFHLKGWCYQVIYDLHESVIGGHSGYGHFIALSGGILLQPFLHWEEIKYWCL